MVIELGYGKFNKENTILKYGLGYSSYNTD
jgi:hypothetical protein